ncbi:putative F-box protein At2g02030 [Argentina anserina]|uniref:putative F-box protein At2g02030 n=1 Tax=Argentina anserina TaxID=57926 RepID=UPI00217661DA|nr:putative F-box protein At2g02030 [Potentilla anserina]
MSLRVGDLSKLSQEMKVQILSRLPPKSLMRFKCVHRSWHALISSSNFAAKHVSVSKDNKLSSSTTILFKRYVFDVNTERRDMVLSLLDLCPDDINSADDDDHLNLSPEDLRVPLSMGLRRRDIWTGIEYVDLACHCNGIICITDYRKRVVLCNPAIKEFNRLPVSCLALYAAEIKPQGSSTAAVGFGCNINCEDYKVVRVLYSQREFNEKNDIKIHPPRAEVYSLATKYWREIKAGALDNGSKNVWPDSTVSIYCKGNLYWRGHEDEKEYFEVPLSYTDEDANSGGEETFFYEDKERIISFDIDSETFHVMRFPNGYYYYHKVFGLWRDSVAVGLSWCADYQCVHIFVLNNKGGDEGSWINCFAIEPVVYIEFQLAFVGTSGQSILVAVNKCAMVLYDYITKRVKYLPVNGVSLWNSQALFYVNSVVSVNGYSDGSDRIPKLVQEA